MKRIYFLLFLGFALSGFTEAQTYLTKNGKISFFSKTSMENIEAVNNQAVSVFNSSHGDIAFSVIIKGFLFKKALMQEHFNENYMESDKYPKATFKGNIADLAKIDLAREGEYPVKISGDLTLHGVTKKANTTGKITVKSGKVSASSEFSVLLADYKISIPKVVENNISPTIKINVACNYELRK